MKSTNRSKRPVSLANSLELGLEACQPTDGSHQLTDASTAAEKAVAIHREEYALYRQLLVFSFGVVLLELLSGKNVVLSTDGGQAQLLTDWAWSRVREGRVMDVIKKGIHELSLPEVMENYVLIAVLSAHPQLYARLTMEQIVKILESNHDMVPQTPDCPLSFIA
ncbi:probable LRR receptor-like serine/threonine-protein kinase RKF3 [Cornus florida]|uniref:probable LRR receptor-like serine/threonine-protein kinase RKF3 n=1 Tax=Cornus florida TaxID=4283 RepID=UPI00289E0F39|nr:probable LRR receptor-like serine/threonine-protein kinase RKF3 [Cornus florida]